MLDDDASLERDEVFRIGRVTSVEGRRVRVAVDKDKNSSHLLYMGEVVRNVAVASYIKITKGFVELVAKVDGEFVEEDRTANPLYQRATDRVKRFLDVNLIGYLEKGRFERGVRELPLLDNECFILSEDEFRRIHAFVGDTDKPLEIGVLAMEPTQPVAVGVNAIFASHVGIFGNTGSGKSYTLAKLYHELLGMYGSDPGFRERAQLVLIDFNGEYVNRPGKSGEYATSVIADDSLKKAYKLSTQSDKGDQLPLPKSAVHDATFWTVLLSATEKTQAPFISRVLGNPYWETLLPDSNALLDVIGDLVARATRSTDPSMDRQLPITFMEEIESCLGLATTDGFRALIQDFKDNLGFFSKTPKFYWGEFGNSPKWSDDTDWHDFIKSKILGVKQDFVAVTDVDLVRFKLVMQYYRDIINGYANREHIGPMMKRLDERVPSIKRLVRVSDDAFSDAPLTIISLRNVSLEMRKVIPMILCKHLYEAKKLSDPLGQRYLNLIIDEAHNILSTESARESEEWRDYRLETFEEIIKEGRKFGIFLTISSQRPHDISPTIISQLHNYFLHRLVNNLDILAVEKAVAYLDKVSFESLPILPTGACIVAGVSAQIPIVVKVTEIPEAFEPNSRTMSITEEWAKPVPQSRADVPAEF